MSNSPCFTGEMSKNRRKKRRKEGFITHTSDDNNLQTENSTGKRRSKDGSKSRTDAYHHHHLTVITIHLKYARKLIGYGTTHLHSGSFSTGRAAKQVSQHRSYVNKGSHPKRNNIMGRTDFFYQEVISLCRSPSPIMIHQSNKQTGYRQESNNPKVVFAIVCCPMKRNQQEC